jgi:hypothetical protein
MKWQPIETAPKDGTRILLFIEDQVIEGHWDDSWPMWCTAYLSSHGCGCCSSSNEEPTHWMPLPAKPEKETEQ